MNRLLEARHVSRSYAISTTGLAAGLAGLWGTYVGAAFVGPPEPRGVVAGIVAAVITVWLLAGALAPTLERSGLLRAVVLGAVLGIASLIVAAVAAGVVGFLWPTVSAWGASSLIEAIGAAMLWLVRLAGLPVVVCGCVFGASARWGLRRRAAA